MSDGSTADIMDIHEGVGQKPMHNLPINPHYGPRIHHGNKINNTDPTYYSPKLFEN